MGHDMNSDDGFDYDIAWRRVWLAAAPLLPTRGLERLRTALAEDDPRLLQEATTSPPPLACVQDWPCEGGCLIAYPVAFEDGDGALTNYIDEDGSVRHLPASAKTVGEVEERFAKVCYEVDKAVGEPAAIRYLLNQYDSWPRADMRRHLLPCVEAELERRKAVSL